MKQIRIIEIAVIVLLCLTLGCTEDKLDTFTSERGGVYFAVEIMKSAELSKPNRYVEESSFSFSEVSYNSYLMEIPIGIMGLPSQDNRTVTIEVDEANTTAVKGVHYTLDTLNMVLHPNSIQVRVQLELLRDTSLLSKDYFVTLKLKENEWFDVSPLVELVDVVNDDVIALYKHKIIISGILQPPPELYWNLYDLLGVYTLEKHLLLNSLCAITSKEWEDASYDDIIAWHIILRNHLQRKHDEGNPVREKNGDLMMVTGLKFD